MRLALTLLIAGLLALIGGCNNPLSWEEVRIYEQQRDLRAAASFLNENGYCLPYGAPDSALDPYREPDNPIR
jgi:hypothetical protein